MNISEFCIRRPVATLLMSVALIVAVSSALTRSSPAAVTVASSMKASTAPRTSLRTMSPPKALASEPVRLRLRPSRNSVTSSTSSSTQSSEL